MLLSQGEISKLPIGPSKRIALIYYLRISQKQKTPALKEQGFAFLLIRFKADGAHGETRTRTAFATTPSR